MFLPVGPEKDLPPEAVGHHADEAVVKPQPHGLQLSVKHTEQAAGIGRGVKVPAVPRPGQAGDGQVLHLVHPVVAHLAALAVIGHQIIVFIVPDQRPGTDLIPAAVPPQTLFHPFPAPAQGPLKIMEADLFSGVDGLVQGVHGVIDALVHGFDAAGDIDLPLELPGLVAGGKALHLLDELIGLFSGDEPGGLHRVHQQLQLRQFKGAGGDKIAPGAAVPPLFNVHAHHPQGLQVVVQTLSVPHVHTLRPEQLHHPGDGHGVLLVGLPVEDIGQIQQLGLLILTFCHGMTSFDGNGSAGALVGSGPRGGGRCASAGSFGALRHLGLRAACGGPTSKRACR